MTMDRSTRLFWSLVGLLLLASAFFGISVEVQRRHSLRAAAPIESGDLVQLDRVIEGDTIVVVKDGAATTVRIVGLKTFDTLSEKDVATVFGRSAEDRLRELAANKSLRVLLHSTPRDRRGRTLATLYVDDQDLALLLIREGLGLVYTVHPFPAMAAYLQEQAAARTARRGLWAQTEATERAEALMRQMREAKP